MGWVRALLPAPLMNTHDLTHPLHLLGLERERSMGEKALTALGFVALGTLVGAAVGLLLAPKEGRQLRAQIRGHATGMLFSGKQTLTNGHARVDADPYSISS